MHLNRRRTFEKTEMLEKKSVSKGENSKITRVMNNYTVRWRGFHRN